MLLFQLPNRGLTMVNIFIHFAWTIMNLTYWSPNSFLENSWLIHGYLWPKPIHGSFMAHWWPFLTKKQASSHFTKSCITYCLLLWRTYLILNLFSPSERRQAQSDTAMGNINIVCLNKDNLTTIFSKKLKSSKLLWSSRFAFIFEAIFGIEEGV